MVSTNLKLKLQTASFYDILQVTAYFFIKIVSQFIVLENEIKNLEQAKG